MAWRDGENVDDKYSLWVDEGLYYDMVDQTRWINHSCEPNCEADEVDGRIFIKSLRALKPGQELFYDYGLIIDDRYTPKLKKEYECRCGSKKCRGTMLAPKR